jgi:hypothetical protein
LEKGELKAMTIGIVIVVPDGIALAADTQTGWNRTITHVQVKGVAGSVELERPIIQPAGWSPGAKKLFPFRYGEHEGAILTAGMSTIGMRTARAVFKKLERECPATDNCQEVVDYLVEGLKAELAAVHKVDDLSKASRVTRIEFVFMTFEDKDITRPFVASGLVFSGTMSIEGSPNNSGYHLRWKNLPNRYGACWIGRTEFIAHLVNHKNPLLPPISGQYYLMTLEDAVNYAKFLAEFTCDFQDFAITVPDCGRPVVTAVLTPEEFRYVHNPPAF